MPWGSPRHSLGGLRGPSTPSDESPRRGSGALGGTRPPSRCLQVPSRPPSIEMSRMVNDYRRRSRDWPIHDILEIPLEYKLVVKFEILEYSLEYKRAETLFESGRWNILLHPSSLPTQLCVSFELCMYSIRPSIQTIMQHGNATRNTLLAIKIIA